MESPFEDVGQGKLIADRYQLIEEIGRGATSIVYSAYDTRLNRKVAVKIIPKSETLEDRIKRELQVTASLNHPNIVNLYDFLVSENYYVVVMEFVEGVSLRKMLEKRKKIPWDKAIYIAVQIASALEEAHRKSIIHKDIKPENILVSRTGQVKLADFGIASLISRQKHQPVSGTIGYMSPEQITGKYIDETSDVFSLGTVLYEMLTGKNPFVADDYRDAVNRILNLVPEEPNSIEPTVPAKLSEIAMKAISKDPDFRFQSAAAFKKALLDFQQSLIKKPKSVKAPEEPKIPRKRPHFESKFLKFLYMASFFYIVFFLLPVHEFFKGPVGLFISLSLLVLAFANPMAANIIAALASSVIFISKNVELGIALLVSLSIYLIINSESQKNLLAPLPFLETVFSRSGLFPFSGFLVAAFGDTVSALIGGFTSALVGMMIRVTSNPENLPFFSSLKGVKMPQGIWSFLELTFFDPRILFEVFIISLSFYIAALVRKTISGRAYARYVSIFTLLATLVLGYQIYGSVFEVKMDSASVFFSSFPGFLFALAVSIVYEFLKKSYEKET